VSVENESHVGKLSVENESHVEKVTLKSKHFKLGVDGKTSDSWISRIFDEFRTFGNWGSDLGHLPENIFKRISAYSNPKAQKRFRENEMTSFFGKVSRYPGNQASPHP